MTLIVGLGNPGKQYENNRHNVGYMVIDALLDDLSSSTSSKNAFKGELFKTSDILLLKPTTYMNLSGESVRAVSDYYKPQKIIVIHDDLDLPFGTVKFKQGGGNGGHNGLKSIDAHIGNDYIRVRIGIGKPQDKNLVANYVLGDFSKTQNADLQALIAHCTKASLALVDKKLTDVANKYTKKDVLS